METLRFKNDVLRRKKLWTAESFRHPAKGHIAMWEEIVLRYSRDGETILDPMAGVGTTLIAALMGRNVICIELESHFVAPMKQSWDKMQHIPMLGQTIGNATIIQGDARLLPLQSADCVITSPPYEGSIAQGQDGIDWEHTMDRGKPRNKAKDARNEATTRYRGYTRPIYERLKAKTEAGNYKGVRPDCWTSEGNLAAQGYLDGYSGRIENIGNLRGEAYWDSMQQVYAECWRVLRPGGIMALVLKGYTRKGKYVDLPRQTEALLLKAGWVKHDHWRRELWNLSFWRTLQKQKNPEGFDDRLKYEEVLAFRKPIADGNVNCVDAVITSPPY